LQSTRAAVSSGARLRLVAGLPGGSVPFKEVRRIPGRGTRRAPAQRALRLLERAHRAPPQASLHEPAELDREVGCSRLDRLESDLLERRLPVDRLRRLALAGSIAPELREKFFQTVKSL